MATETQGAETVKDWSLATPDELLQGYQEMAADHEREAEAHEWSEALIGDAFEAR